MAVAGPSVPISYRVDSERSVLFAEWTGDVDRDECEAYLRQVVGDPVALACGRSLSDLRRARLSIKGEEVRQLVETILLPARPPGGWKTAFLVSSAVQFGIARQFDALAEAFGTSQPFHDYDAALRWLLEANVA